MERIKERLQGYNEQCYDKGRFQVYAPKNDRTNFRENKMKKTWKEQFKKQKQVMSCTD